MTDNLSKIREAIQSVLNWHKAISDYQKPLLQNGFENACKNWDVATDIQVLDMEPLEQSLTLLTELEQSQALVEVVTVGLFINNVAGVIGEDNAEYIVRTITHNFPNGIKITKGG